MDYKDKLNKKIERMISDPKNMYKYINGFKYGGFNYGDYRFTSLLAYVVLNGNIEVINFIINNGGINIQDKDGYTMLFYAASHKRDHEMVKFLISHGNVRNEHIADVNIKYNHGRSILQYMLYHDYNDKFEVINVNFEMIAESIIEQGLGGTINSQDDTGRTVMHDVMETNDLEKLKFLLYAIDMYGGDEDNIRDNNNNTKNVFSFHENQRFYEFVTFAKGKLQININVGDQTR